MKTLTFLRSLSVEQFRAHFNLNPGDIQVLRNPATQKFFFSVPSVEWEGKTFSGAAMPTGREIFSLVKGESGEKFWLLHAKGAGTAELVERI